MSDVFISYSQHDRPVANELAHDLRQLGMNVWWDADLYEAAHKFIFGECGAQRANAEPMMR